MPKSFRYHRANDLDDACRLMNELQDVQLLSGGTDLLVDIDTGLRKAKNVVSISNLDELCKIEEVDNKMIIGAGCTASNVEDSQLVKEKLPDLAKMIVFFASPQIRNRATLAGNICSAVACGDFPPILMAHGATVELCSSEGKREIPLSEFFHHNRETARQGNEILTKIMIPIPPKNAAVGFKKFRRRQSNSLALVSAAAYLEMDGDICKAARIVLGAVAPTPLLVKEAGESLVGRKLDEASLDKAAKHAKDEARPISDVRGAEDFRRDLVYVLTGRALREARERITPGSDSKVGN